MNYLYPYQFTESWLPFPKEKIWVVGDSGVVEGYWRRDMQAVKEGRLFRMNDCVDKFKDHGYLSAIAFHQKLFLFTLEQMSYLHYLVEETENIINKLDGDNEYRHAARMMLREMRTALDRG